MSDAFKTLLEQVENPSTVEPFYLTASAEICDYLEGAAAPGKDTMRTLAAINVNVLVNALISLQRQKVSEQELFEQIEAYAVFMNEYMNNSCKLIPLLTSIANARN